MLKIEDMHVYYGAIHAVKGVSFEVGEGEIVALIGANGAGKSTTLRTITGLVKASGGSVQWDGQELLGKSIDKIISTGIALCGQDKPTQDMALFTRVLFLAFSKTSFSKPERDAYEDLVAMCSLGNTHLTIEVLKNRQLFEKNFSSAYTLTKSELSKIIEGEKIHDRIFGNGWKFV